MNNQKMIDYLSNIIRRDKELTYPNGWFSCSISEAEEIVALLKEQEIQQQCLMKKCVICPHCKNCDVDENGQLKEQETELCDRCGRRRVKSNRILEEYKEQID